MSIVARARTHASSALAGNVAARIGALVSLAAGTFAVAKAGGPEAVGVYALLRVLPGLVGVAISAGLPGAIAYFLAGPSRSDRRMPATIVAIAVLGGVAGTLLWALGAVSFGSSLFPDLSLALMIWAGGTVFTQLIVATAKSCSQGSDDMRGANLVIFNEEFMFLPAYGVLWAVGIRGYVGLIAGLMLADILTFVLAWIRLAGRGFFEGAARPSIALGREVSMYGLRAQVGGVVSLLNLRFDFIVLNLLAGPAVLGVYSIASKFAELLKIPALALTYVLYPQFAREGPAQAAATARRLVPKATILTALGAVPLLLTAGLVIPLYGDKFHPGILPARIIVFGLAIEGAAGVMTAFMYGIGRPGLNSIAMAGGLIVTVVLDFALIPSFGATGAAVASAVAYITSTLALGWYFMKLTRPRDQLESSESLPALASSTNGSHGSSSGGSAGGVSFVAFAPTPDGYQLLECVGETPAIGTVVDVPNRAPGLVVTKLGRSPLPFDRRPCAYLEPFTPNDAPPDGSR
jgi:O-antigen/teichoic acid export membrane protein